MMLVFMLKFRLFFQASAAHKLPCLYLVDSIIKNVGAPYIEHISKCVVRVFSNTFNEVMRVTVVVNNQTIYFIGWGAIHFSQSWG